MEKRSVYLDYNATTPLAPEVRDEMVREMDVYANASSMHESGRFARSRIERARANVARLVGVADPERLVFTSGGSESNNTVFNTAFLLAPEGRRKIVTTSIEHPCVLNAAKFLESRGFEVVFLPVDGRGKVGMDDYARAVDGTTYLVSVMAANNEIGTVQDVAAFAKLARENGALFHTDATQAIGKIPADFAAWGVDYATLSCHKLYGPKGVGALYVRKGAPIEPLIRGGHQEHGYRAGTYNNLGIIGFGKAAEVAIDLGEAERGRVWSLRERLREGFLKAIPGIRVNGHPTDVLPNTLNVSFPGAEGEAILLYLDLAGIRVSTGSACASGSLDPSHVLMATGVGPELAHGSIRFSLGRGTTEEEISYVLEQVPPVIKRLRDMSTVGFQAD